MDNWVEIKKDPVHISREKQKARKLRNSIWWKQEISKGTMILLQKKICSCRFNDQSYYSIGQGW